MKYALINRVKHEAVKGMQGICPSCGSDMIARCGALKVHHWAHKRTNQCDNWWEPETEWHRAWKEQFSEDWQEVVMFDASTGDKHIADVRTENGLVLEFQHSPIDIQERNSRERFYKDMIWIVDGRRSIRNLKRFQKNRSDLKAIGQNLFTATFPDEIFPAQWLDSNVPVLFDFPMDEPSTPHNPSSSTLWCLFNFQLNGSKLVASFTKEWFVKTTKNGEWPEIILNLKHRIQLREEESRRRQIVYYTRPQPSPYVIDPKTGGFVKRRRF